MQQHLYEILLPLIELTVSACISGHGFTTFSLSHLNPLTLASSHPLTHCSSGWPFPKCPNNAPKCESTAENHHYPHSDL